MGSGHLLLASGDSAVGLTILLICISAAAGLALGELRVLSIHLGIAGALFAGILVAHFGKQWAMVADPAILGFLREFGLILFVYTIGIQVGPGFFNSLRKQGIQLNLLSAAVVLLGAACAWAMSVLLSIDMAAMAGIFSGATTNTPSLGAVQEAIKTLPTLRSGLTPEVAALGYAVAYPFGIVGILLTMVLIRQLFKVDCAAEAAVLENESKGNADDQVDRVTLRVANENLAGLPVEKIPGIRALGVVVSRIRRNGQTEQHIATPETILHEGDLIVVVGKKAALREMTLIVGEVSSEDLFTSPGELTIRRLVVTRKEVLGDTLGELALTQRFGITVTRVLRSEIVLPATPELAVQFGDVLHVVGPEKGIAEASAQVGNSAKLLNSTNFIAVFVGIALGVIIGSVPIHLPGMPAAVKLGLAGGPLLAAIVLSWVGRIGPLVWYMPATANAALREFGIVLFLACVGLKAGDKFFELLAGGNGLLWMAAGAVVTLVPLLLVGFFARLVLKMNFMNVCGLLAGSMTDPPALAFAGTLTGSSTPSIAYATIYPLTMMLRILSAQMLVLLFCR
ncbi:putative transporter [Verrucomicrobia bacterium LW23]|nr:putative transporter [Verrucomicrobia bacterium LW23]